MICNGCLKEIDPAFDATSLDGRGRRWHTPCWVNARGAQDRDPHAEHVPVPVALHAGAKLVDRWQLRRRRRGR